MIRKSHENRVRRKAERLGLKLSRSRRKDPKNPEYRKYHIYDPNQDRVIEGATSYRHELTLDVAEQILDNLDLR